VFHVTYILAKSYLHNNRQQEYIGCELQNICLNNAFLYIALYFYRSTRNYVLLSDYYLNADAIGIYKTNIYLYMYIYTHTHTHTHTCTYCRASIVLSHWRVRLQHHAKRALKPLGTIALLSSITCRKSETSVSGSFKLTLPPLFLVILWSSTTEEEGQRKRQIYCILGRISPRAKKVHGGSKYIKQNYKTYLR